MRSFRVGKYLWAVRMFDRWKVSRNQQALLDPTLNVSTRKCELVESRLVCSYSLPLLNKQVHWRGCTREISLRDPYAHPILSGETGRKKVQVLGWSSVCLADIYQQFKRNSSISVMWLLDWCLCHRARRVKAENSLKTFEAQHWRSIAWCTNDLYNFVVKWHIVF